MKPLFGEPRKIENTTGGNCDLCGKDLSATKWVEHEHTACSKAHCLELQRLERADLEQDDE